MNDSMTMKEGDGTDELLGDTLGNLQAKRSFFVQDVL